jgi:hypothetical protein
VAKRTLSTRVKSIRNLLAYHFWSSETGVMMTFVG